MNLEAHTSSRQSLDKVISFRSYLAIGLGIVLGVGWVVFAGQWLSDGGPLGAMIAFLLGGLILIPVGKCYAELTSAIPVAGGELAFSFKAFGSFVAFLTAWALTLSYVAATPFETIAIGTLLESIVPPITTDALYHVNDIPVSFSNILPGVVVGIYLIWLNYKGAESSARFQKLVLAALLVCTVVFTAVAFVKGDVSNLRPLFAQQGALWAVAPASIISVIVVVPFFLAGFDAIPQAAEEAGMKMQPQQLGTAIVATIVGGTVFYVLIILALSLAMPWQASSQFTLPVAEVFRVAFGYEWAAKLVLITALLGLITTLNGLYITASRLIFALARGGLLPDWFARVHPVHHTPANAVLFVGAISLAGPLVGRAAMGPIVNSGSLAFTVAYLVTCLAAIRLRTSAPDMKRPYVVNKSTLYAGAVVALALVLLMVLPQSAGQLSNVEFLIIGGWMAAGAIGFAWRRKKDDMDDEHRALMILGDYR